MFCPSCGTEYTIGLPYCNRCGANLNAALTAQPEPVLVNLTKPTLIIGTAITLLTLGGFGLLIGGAIELAHNVQMGSDAIIVMIALGMITILSTDIFLVRQLSKLISASLSSGTPPKSKRQRTFAAPGQPRLQQPLPAHLHGAPSVTENTTRFLEPEYREPFVDDPAIAKKSDR